jgi:hypothetical protein
VALNGPGQVRVGAAAFSFDTGDMVIVDPLKVHGVTRMTPEHTALVVRFPGAAVAAGGLAADACSLMRGSGGRNGCCRPRARHLAITRPVHNDATCVSITERKNRKNPSSTLMLATPPERTVSTRIATTNTSSMDHLPR